MKISENHKSRQTLHTVRSKTYSVICLSILMFYLIRPVLPFIEYAINKDYIAKNLCINKDKPQNCCQGKCYLGEQLKKNADTQDSNTGNNKKTLPSQRVEDHMPSKGIVSITVESKIILVTSYAIRIIDSFLPLFFVPPKF
jgi:hypothetical protein